MISLFGSMGRWGDGLLSGSGAAELPAEVFDAFGSDYGQAGVLEGFGQAEQNDPQCAFGRNGHGQGELREACHVAGYAAEEHYHPRAERQ